MSGKIPDNRYAHELSIRMVALMETWAQLRRGETAGNNAGGFIDYLRTNDRTRFKRGRKKGQLRGAGGTGAWCAVGISAAYSISWGDMAPGESLPFETSRGARELVRFVGKAGRKIDIPLRGAIACKDRPGEGWWSHVVAIRGMAGGMVLYVDGNGANPLCDVECREMRYKKFMRLYGKNMVVY